MIELVGYVGSVGAALMWLPQASRAVAGRRDPTAVAGISPTSFLLAMLFNALLASYGTLEHATPVVVAGCVNFCCAVAIMTSIAASRRHAR